MLLQKIDTILHPERFQGAGLQKNYFEGWYFKISDFDRDLSLAIIVGISITDYENQHCFIQHFDGVSQVTNFYEFPLSSFKYERDRFWVKIEDNEFSNNLIKVSLPDLKLNLHLENQAFYPSTLLFPGILGPFAYIPFIECKHGLVCLNGNAKGRLNLRGKPIPQVSSKVYIEKDWGTSFPKDYIWLQCNEFDKSDVSFQFAIAKVGWMGLKIEVFVCTLLIEGKIETFATWNLAKVHHIDFEVNTVMLAVGKGKKQIRIKASYEHTSSLISPINGQMKGKVEESITGRMNLELFRDKEIFKLVGRNAGIEVCGKYKQKTKLRP